MSGGSEAAGPGAGAPARGAGRPVDALPSMQRTLRAARVSAILSAAFALLLWVMTALDPSVIIIVGASFTTARAVTGILVATGVRFSRRHTRSFPEGLYKVENVLALAIGLFIVIGAWELGRYAVAATMRGVNLIPYPWQSLTYMAIAAALSLALGLYKLRVARAEGCVALRADAVHSFVDFVGCGILCMGLILDIGGVPAADSVAAVVVAAAIIWAGGSIAYQALRVLLDASVERSVLDEVRAVAESDPRVERVVSVAGRNSGSFRFLTVRLVPAAGDVGEAEAVAADVKAAVRSRVPNVDEVVVELADEQDAAGGGRAAEPAGDAPAATVRAGDAEPAAAAVAAASAAPAVAVAAADAPAGAAAGVAAPAPEHRGLHLAPTERAELVSVVVSAVMAAAMIAVAASTASVAVLAEGTDTVVDVVASLVVLAGMRLAARHTKGFPEGLYKLENLTATGIGVLVLFSAYELAREAIARIVSGEDKVEGALLVIVVMCGVVVATGALAWMKLRVGKKYGSPSLLADARHAWTDAAASAGVALGVGLQWAGIPYMDSVAALVVVALLAWSGVEVILDGLRVLLDASLEDDVLDRVRTCAEEQPGVARVAAVLGRNAGSYRFVTLRIVPTDADLAAAERAADGVATAVRAGVERIDRVSVELVPA